MSNQEVALQIVSFLKTAVAQKEVAEDYVDSIDVAIDCLGEAFGVDTNDADKVISSSFRGQNLKEILSAFQTQSSSAGVEIPVHVDEEESKDAVDEQAATKANELKLLGNKAMAARDFEEAINKYTEALELLPNNVVYLSNRAAAYSSLRQHADAIKDAEAAIKADPTYSKAYSRLGLANYALNKPSEALDAYKKGLEVEGDNASPAMKKGYETAKARVEEQLGLDSTPAAREAPAASAPSAGGLPDFSNLASMLGGGGNGGAPNFAEMLNNPQLMQYAQQMMQNPDALNNLMSNPAISQMAKQFGLGGDASGASSDSAPNADASSAGSPDLSSLLNNPALQNLAKDFLGGKK
jgi:small glutamine-rich tetratricopeptide repeat-containing protein alpha